MTMKRLTTAILLGAALVVALAPLAACDDDTTVNTAFKDAAAGEGGEGGEAGKTAEGGSTNEAGSGSEGGTSSEAGATDASDDGG